MAEPTLDKSLSEIPSERRLDSWKEIALYLHRDVTTVQRWEKHGGDACPPTPYTRSEAPSMC